MDEYERRAFIEQLAGASHTHRVVAERTDATLYEGAEACAQLIYRAYMTAYIQGDETVGPVRLDRKEKVVNPLSDRGPQ